MLISVFGVWLMASNISHLVAGSNNTCAIFMYQTKQWIDAIKFNAPCIEVAAKINEQIYLTKGR